MRRRRRNPRTISAPSRRNPADLTMAHTVPPVWLSHKSGRSHQHSNKRMWNEYAKQTAASLFNRGDSDDIKSKADLKKVLKEYRAPANDAFCDLVWRYVQRQHFEWARSTGYTPRTKHAPGGIRLNPLPSSAPSRALLCIGQLRELELYDPKTGRTGHLKPKGKWLAWDGKQFQICNVQGQVNASLPSNIVAKHKKFHAANPQGKPFLASMPSRSASVKNVGLLKSLVYYVPSKIRSPGKNKYLWHHAFGDTGHKGGDSYPTKVMPMLQRDSAGNLFIKRRPGNIFRVDNWLRG